MEARVSPAAETAAPAQPSTRGKRSVESGLRRRGIGVGSPRTSLSAPSLSGGGGFEIIKRGNAGIVKPDGVEVGLPPGRQGVPSGHRRREGSRSGTADDLNPRSDGPSRGWA